MLYKHMETIEAIGLDLFFIVLFFFIGMAIQDVLKRGNVPRLAAALSGWFCFLDVQASLPKV